MLLNEQAQLRKNVLAFERLTKEALDKAYALWTARVRTRDIGTTIWAKMPFGLKSFVTFIHHKACRLVSNVRALDKMLWSKHKLGSPEAVAKLEAKIDDELLDIINYCSFAWAYRRLQEQKEETCHST